MPFRQTPQFEKIARTVGVGSAPRKKNALPSPPFYSDSILFPPLPQSSERVWGLNSFSSLELFRTLWHFSFLSPPRESGEENERRLPAHRLSLSCVVRVCAPSAPGGG